MKLIKFTSILLCFLMLTAMFAGCDTPEESNADIGDNNRLLLRKVKQNRIVNNKNSPQEAARYLGVNFYAKKRKTTVYNT